MTLTDEELKEQFEKLMGAVAPEDTMLLETFYRNLLEALRNYIGMNIKLISKMKHEDPEETADRLSAKSVEIVENYLVDYLWGTGMKTENFTVLAITLLGTLLLSKDEGVFKLLIGTERQLKLMDEWTKRLYGCEE